jgi:hypothetical protein
MATLPSLRRRVYQPVERLTHFTLSTLSLDILLLLLHRALGLAHWFQRLSVPCGPHRWFQPTPLLVALLAPVCRRRLS